MHQTKNGYIQVKDISLEVFIIAIKILFATLCSEEM